MILEASARTRLRPFEWGDLDALAQLTSNPDFMRFARGLWSYEQTADLLERRILAPARAGKPSHFAVLERSSDRLLGYCGFFLQEVDGEEEIEIGYRLDPAFWGKGIATEAARAVRDHAFATLNLEHVISLIHPDNIPSRRVAEKLGMRLARQTIFRETPADVFQLTLAEWRTLPRLNPPEDADRGERSPLT